MSRKPGKAGRKRMRRLIARTSSKRPSSNEVRLSRSKGSDFGEGFGYGSEHLSGSRKYMDYNMTPASLEFVEAAVKSVDSRLLRLYNRYLKRETTHEVDELSFKDYLFSQRDDLVGLLEAARANARKGF